MLSKTKRTLRLSDVRDHWLLTLVGAAVALFAATNVKFLLIPSGLATLIWTFAVGVLVGAVCFVAIAVYLFSEAAHQDDLILKSGPAALGFNPCDVPAGGQHCLPPWAARGKIEGTVWTIAGSQWEDSDTLLGAFPPAHSGDRAVCVKWHARVKDGSLHMYQDPTTTFKAESPEVIPAEVHIPLTSVSVDLMPAATKGKSQWFRKAPMKLIVSDPDARPYAEESFVMFAQDSAAKEQWYLALVWGAAPAEEVPLGLEAQLLYSMYCAHLRPVAPVPLPKLAGARVRSGPAPLDVPSAPKDSNPRRWWGGRMSRKPPRSTPRGPPPPLHSTRSTSVAKSDAARKNVIEDMEWQWAGGQPRPGTDKKAKQRGLGPRRGNLATIKTSPSLESVATARTVGAATLLAAPELASPPPLAAPTGQDSLDADDFPLDGGSMRGQEWSDLGSAAAGAALHPPDAGRSASFDSGRAANASAHSPAGGASPVAGVSPPGSTSFAPSAPMPDLSAGHHPTQLAGLHAMNMFITRIAFDLLRSERFHAAVRDRLMTRLANIHVPNYVTPLRLVGLDLGTTPPFICKAHSLPSPGKAIWPRLVMQVVYHGKCTLTVETNVDFKDSAGFMNFDRAMEVFGGSDEDLSDVDVERTHAPYPGVEGVYGDAAQTLLSSFDAGVAESQSSMRSRGGASPERVPRKRGGLFSMKNMPFRKQIATSVRNVAGLIVEHVSKMPVRVDITLTELDGPLLLWLAPPPSTGLWISFLQPPKMKLICRPVVSNRMIKYTAQAVSVSGWLESKIKSALQKNMVFPACSDISLKFLLSLADLGTAAVRPLAMPREPSREEAVTSDDEVERERAARPSWVKSLSDIVAEAAVAARAAEESAGTSTNAVRKGGPKQPGRARSNMGRDTLKSFSNPPPKHGQSEAKRPQRPLWRRILRVGLPREDVSLAGSGRQASPRTSAGPASAHGAAASVLSTTDAAVGSADPRADGARQGGQRRPTSELRVDVSAASDTSLGQLKAPQRGDESGVVDDGIDEQSWMYDESGVELHTEESEMGSQSPGFRSTSVGQPSPTRSAAPSSRFPIPSPDAHQSAAHAVTGAAEGGRQPHDESCTPVERTSSDEILHQATLAAAAANMLMGGGKCDIPTGSYHFLPDGSTAHTSSPNAPSYLAAALGAGGRALGSQQSINNQSQRTVASALSSQRELTSVTDDRSDASILGHYGPHKHGENSPGGLSHDHALASRREQLGCTGSSALSPASPPDHRTPSEGACADGPSVAQPIGDAVLPNPAPSNIHSHPDVYGGDSNTVSLPERVAGSSSATRWRNLGFGTAPGASAGQTSESANLFSGVESALADPALALSDATAGELRALEVQLQHMLEGPPDADASEVAGCAGSEQQSGAHTPVAGPPRGSSPGRPSVWSGLPPPAEARALALRPSDSEAACEADPLAQAFDPLRRPQALDDARQAAGEGSASAALHRAKAMRDADPLREALPSRRQADMVADAASCAADAASRQAAVCRADGEYTIERLAGCAADSAAAAGPPDGAAPSRTCAEPSPAGASTSRSVPSHPRSALSSLGNPFLSIDLSGSKTTRLKAQLDALRHGRAFSDDDAGRHPREASPGSTRSDLYAMGAESYAAGKALAKEKLQKLGNYADKWLGGLKKDPAQGSGPSGLIGDRNRTKKTL